MVKFIADIGSNHNQDLERVHALIKTAKDVGCWGVKFQLFTPDDLYRELTPEKRADLERAALPPGFIPDIAKWCKEEGLVFGCTPFSIQAVRMLAAVVDYFKISSYEILRLDLIRECSKYEKPIHISTGMANDSEIQSAVNSAPYNDVIVYLCRSDYPARPEDCKFVFKFFDSLFCDGWSDHTVQPGVIYSAVSHGVEYVEFHLDLEDMAGNESKHGHVWRPCDIKRVISDCKIMDIANNSPDFRLYTEDERNQRADPIDGKRPRLNK